MITPTVFSPALPMFAAWNFFGRAVEAQAKLVGNATADVLQKAGYAREADNVRVTFPHYARVNADMAMTFVACGCNPLLYSGVMGATMMGRAMALGMVPFPRLGY